jgi:phage-related tail protein
MATKKAAKKKSRRTVMYSTGGKKLYAVRDASGKFKDIQQYSRAHAMDIKRGSSAETKAAAKKAVKKAAKKTAKKAATVKKSAAKKVTKRTTTAKKAAGGIVKSLKRALKKVTG